MADGGLKLELDENLSNRLIAAAEDAGRQVFDYAAELIDGALDDDWSETERRWAEYEKAGESVSVEEAMTRLRHGLKARFAAKR
jgi:hypothetical protein